MSRSVPHLTLTQAQVLSHLLHLSFRRPLPHTQVLWRTIHIYPAKIHDRVAEINTNPIFHILSMVRTVDHSSLDRRPLDRTPLDRPSLNPSFAEPLKISLVFLHPPKIPLFLLSLGVFSLNVCGFLRAGASEIHVWALGVNV